MDPSSPSELLRTILDTRTRQHSEQVRWRASVALAVCLAVILTVDAFSPLGIAAGALYSVVILAGIWLPWTSTRHLLALTIGLTLLGALKSASVAPGWAVAFNRSISIAVQVGAAAFVVGHRRYETERASWVAQVDLAVRLIRTLEGLVPICAWCKQIRAANGEWFPVEQYIAKHTHAEFTHGICPTCARRVTRDG